MTSLLSDMRVSKAPQTRSNFLSTVSPAETRNFSLHMGTDDFDNSHERFRFTRKFSFHQKSRWEGNGGGGGGWRLVNVDLVDYEKI